MECYCTFLVNRVDLDLINELNDIYINVGDIIVDHFTGYVGVLIWRKRRIDMFRDDVYFWEVKWTKQFHKRKSQQLEVVGTIEEEALKLSILIGTIELYSVKEKNEHSLGN